MVKTIACSRPIGWCIQSSERPLGLWALETVDAEHAKSRYMGADHTFVASPCTLCMVTIHEYWFHAFTLVCLHVAATATVSPLLQQQPTSASCSTHSPRPEFIEAQQAVMMAAFAYTLNRNEDTQLLSTTLQTQLP